MLVRHADAVPEGPALQDEHRYLSAEGRAQCRALGGLLADAGVAIGAVVTSPLVRAVQTAELVAGAIGWAGVIEASLRLAPGASVRIGAGWLEQTASLLSGGVVLAVGHEPSMSALTELLAGGAHATSFRKAEACLVEDGAVRWRIEAT